MADVRQRAVEGNPVADVDVEAVLPVGLVYSVRLSQREGLSLLAITWLSHKDTHVDTAMRTFCCLEQQKFKLHHLRTSTSARRCF